MERIMKTIYTFKIPPIKNMAQFGTLVCVWVYKYPQKEFI